MPSDSKPAPMLTSDNPEGYHSTQSHTNEYAQVKHGFSESLPAIHALITQSLIQASKGLDDPLKTSQVLKNLTQVQKDLTTIATNHTLLPNAIELIKYGVNCLSSSVAEDGFRCISDISAWHAIVKQTHYSLLEEANYRRVL